MLENLDVEALTNDYVMPWSINIAMALVIFLVGRVVVSIVVNICRKLLTRAHMDEMLVSFACSMLRWILLLFVIIAALGQLGINTNSLVALLGAAGLAIGLSLQSSLQNFAARGISIPFPQMDVHIEQGGD